MNTNSTNGLTQSLNELKSKILNPIVLAFAILSVPLLFASLYRIVFTGWKWIYLIQTLIVIVIWSIFLFRKILSTAYKANIIILILAVVACLGLYHFGILGNGKLFLIVIPVFTAIFIGRKYAYITIGVVLTIMIAFAFLYLSNRLQYSYDVDKYIHQSSLWIATTITIATIILGLQFINEKYFNFFIASDKKIRESEEKYRRIFENIEDGYILAGFDGNIISVNPAASSMLGYNSPDELINKNITKEVYMDPGNREKLKKLLDESDYIKGYIIEFKQKSGKSIIADCNVHYIYDKNEKPFAIEGTFRDITEKLSKERALIESETRYRILIENSIFPVVVTNMDGQVLFANRYAFDFFETPQGNFDEYDVKSFWNNPDERAGFINELKTKGKVDNFEFEVKIGSGEIKTVLASTRIIDYAGQKALYNIYNDITDRIIAEQALKESEERFRRLSNISFEGIIIHDKGKCVAINEAICRLTGYKSEELIGQNVISKLVKPEFADLVMHNIKNRVEKPYEIEIQNKEGKTIPIELEGRDVIWNGKKMRVGAARDITERKKAAQQLLETNVLLETIFNNTHILIAYLDPHFNFIKVNQRYAQADHKEPVFFQGKNHFDLYPNEENEAIFKEVIKKGEPYLHYAKPFTYPDDTEKKTTYWDWSLIPVKDKENKVNALVLTLLDVTKRIQSELASKESETKFRNIFNNSKDAIIISDFDQNILNANWIAAENIGLPLEELIGEKTTRFIHDAYQTALLERVQKMKDQDVTPVEIEIITNEDVTIPIEINSTKIEYEGKDAILSVLRNTTERKKAEQALKESEENYRIMAETSPDAVTTTDLNGTITFASDRTAEIHGYQYANELIGTNAVDLIADEDRERAIAGFQPALEKGTIRDIEYKCRKKDGTEFYGEMSVAVLKNIENEPTGYLAITKDTTDRKIAKLKLEERLLYEQIISELSTKFVNLPIEYINEEITNGFMYIGESLNIGRIVLWETVENIDKYHVNSFWSNEGIENPPGTLDSNMFPYIKKTLLNKKIFKFSSFDEIPKEAVIEKEYYRQQGIKSGLIIPLTIAEEVIGGISFSVLKENRDWPEDLIRFFFILGDVISNALKRKNSELILRESEEQFRSLASNIPGAVYRCETEAPWPMDFISENIFEITGYNALEFIHKKIRFGDLILIEDRNDVNNQIKKAIQNRKPFRLEYRMKHTNGNIHWVMERGQATYDIKGNPLWLDGILIDITEKKKAEQALQESEERFRLLIENIPAVTWVTSQKGITSYISPNVKKVYGYTPEEIYKDGAKLWLDRIHPDDVESVKNEYGQLFDGNTAYDIEYRIKRKDGKWIWLHDRANLFRKQESGLYAYGVFSDITREKQAENEVLFKNQELMAAEEEIRANLEKLEEVNVELEKKNRVLVRAYEKLEENEKRYYTLFNSANDTIFLMKDNRFVECNKKTYQMFGVRHEEIIDHTPTDFSPDFQPDGSNTKEKVKERIDLALKGKPQFFEWKHRKLNGELFDAVVGLNAIKIRDEKNILAIVRDISEIKQKHKEIINAVINAEEKERNRIARDLHDGIAPILSAIKLFLQSMLNSDDKHLQKQLAVKSESAINEAVKSLSEISAKLSPHILQNFGVVEAVRTFTNKISSIKKIHFKFKTNLKERLEENIEITIYRTITELINNTLKYADANRVDIILLKDKDISLTYKDNGKGFDLNNILTKTKGMGLHNLKTRIESVNGTHHIYSAPGKGVKVKITIPKNG